MSTHAPEKESINKEALEKVTTDLNNEYPRSPHSLAVAGIVLLDRAVDKCRGVIMGIAGGYHTNSPLDKLLLTRFGIEYSEFREQVASGATDEHIGQWFAKTANNFSKEAQVLWNNEMRYMRMQELPISFQVNFEDKVPEHIPPEKIHQIRYFFDYFDIKEGRM